MIRCGLISKYLEIKSFLLIYLPQFRRDFFLDSLFFLTPCTPKSLMTKSYFIQISVKPLHWNCSLVFLLATFAREACYHNSAVFCGGCWRTNVVHFFFTGNSICFVLQSSARNPLIPILILLWDTISSSFFTSCLSKGAANPITSAPFSPPSACYDHHKMIPVSSLSLSSWSSPPPPPCSTEPFARPFHSLPALEPLTIIWVKYVSNRKWNEMPQRKNHLNTILKKEKTIPTWARSVKE